jgi:tyrosyl-DNA phosphodiesterase-1
MDAATRDKIAELLAEDAATREKIAELLAEDARQAQLGGGAVSDDEVVCTYATSPKRARTEPLPEDGVGDGVGFRLTRVDGHPLEPPPKNAGSVVFADLVPPASDATGAVRWVALGNFEFVIDWLINACPPLALLPKVMLFVNERDAAALAAAVAGVLPTFEVYAPPLRFEESDANAYGSHHSKYALVLFERCCRVSIHTANYCACDWSGMTQGVWTQSFPLKSARAGAPSTSPFETELLRYLESYRWPGSTIAGRHISFDALRAYDFSGARVALVASVPGRHSGAARDAFGHLRLRKLLSDQRFDARFVGAAVACQFSSAAEVTAGFLSSMQASLSAGSTDAQLPLGPAASFALVWPTMEEVRASVSGWRGGGCLPGDARFINEPRVRVLHHRWSSSPDGPEGRARVPPHIKSFSRYLPSGELAWFCLGSHNFSRAAWGSTYPGCLHIKNYELAVVFLPSLVGGGCSSLVTTASRGGTRAGLAASGALALRVPYPLPPLPYRGVDDVPWGGKPVPLNVRDARSREYRLNTATGKVELWELPPPW